MGDKPTEGQNKRLTMISLLFMAAFKQNDLWLIHLFDKETAKFLLRATACSASRVLAIVEVSVCPSVTPLSPIKTAQARITKSSLWAAPKTLVFSDKISCPCRVKGFPSNEGVKEGYSL